VGRTEHKGRSRVATVVDREDQGSVSRVAPTQQRRRSAPETSLRTDPRTAPLERKASGPILDELFLLEVELHRRYQAYLAQTKPQPSAAKASIVAALRSKH